jgi:hypothetical protein
MTEAEWLQAVDPGPMFQFVKDTVGERKLRLFEAACCRRTWHLLPGDHCKQAVAAAEAFADRELSEADFRTMRNHADAAMRAVWDEHHEDLSGMMQRFGAIAAATAARLSLAEHPGNPEYVGPQLCGTMAIDRFFSGKPPDNCHDEVRRAIQMSLSAGLGADVDDATRWALADRADRAEAIEQAVLLRHIIGNPFEPILLTAHFPETVGQLAQTLYQGEACHFALHDALLDAGHGELAEHFREPYHPKGCWAVDLILGKS